MRNLIPIERERHDLFRALRKMEETLYTLYQEAYIIGDDVMQEKIKDLIEAVVFTYNGVLKDVVFTYESADMSKKGMN